jgi:hypothetical protein
MSNAVIVKTRKFMRNPLLSRKQVCYNVSCVIIEFDRFPPWASGDWCGRRE